MCLIIQMPNESKGRHTHTRPEHSIQVNGLAASVTVLVSKFGLMVLAMKEIGRITGPTASASSLISTVMSTKAIGSMIRPTARASTFM